MFQKVTQLFLIASLKHLNEFALFLLTKQKL